MSGYVIHVGHHAPSKVIVATPDRNTGMPTGDPIEVYKSPGVVQLINRARVWARRVQPDGKLPVLNGTEQPLEVNDPRYRGTLEFLKWGDMKVGAQAIEIRYLKQSSSLDYDYQRVIQKIETKVEDGTDFIYLNPGENKFDDQKEALLVQLLKVYPQNRESVSKNPDPQFKGYTYVEITNESRNKSLVEQEEKALDAGILIKNMSTKPVYLRNLLDVIQSSGSENENPILQSVNHLSTDGQIYESLLFFAKANPTGLMAHINSHKERIKDRLSYAESFKALDDTKAGFVAINVNGTPEIIWIDVPEKGKKWLEWVLDNWMTEEVYMGTKKLFDLSSKLK